MIGTRIQRLVHLTVVLAAIFMSSTTRAFCPTPISPVSTAKRTSTPAAAAAAAAAGRPTTVPVVSRIRTASATQLHFKGTNDGTDRGLIVQAFILGICIWFFTVPPEFRRAYFCPADVYCQEEGSCTKDCITYEQWFKDVGDYYKYGGGIQWDFSIDPKTKLANQNKIDALLQK